MDRFFSVFKTSGNALAIQRRRVQIASENLANSRTTETGNGPYKPKRLHLSQPEEAGFRRTLLNSVLKMRTVNDLHREEPEIEQQLQETVNLAPSASTVEENRFRYEYDPGHPDADENGMVRYPDIDMVEEMTNLVSANRLYEANLSVIEAEKEIIKRSFEI
ncbi:MAG: flagellar basal body rod protein FlgC [Balneolaceae bacterium]